MTTGLEARERDLTEGEAEGSSWRRNHQKLPTVKLVNHLIVKNRREETLLSV
jgi:hypothetical protein